MCRLSDFERKDWRWAVAVVVVVIVAQTGSHYSAQRFGSPAPQTVTDSEQAVEKMDC